MLMSIQTKDNNSQKYPILFQKCNGHCKFVLSFDMSDFKEMKVNEMNFFLVNKYWQKLQQIQNISTVHFQFCNLVDITDWPWNE